MTQYEVAPRRRIGLRAPITGLVLIAVVVYGTYWGWNRAFGETTDASPVQTGCPTPTATLTGTPSVPATTAAAAALADTIVVQPSVVMAPAAYGTVVLAATTTPATPTATPTPAFLAPADVVVNVYNATSRPGLAGNTAAILRDRGFTVDTIDNAAADDVVPEVAQIRAATADSAEVRLLVQHVPGAVVVPDGRADATVDLVLGEQFVALGDPAVVTPVPLPSRAC